MKPLRIGLLVEGTAASVYVAEFVRWAQARNDVEVSHLIVVDAPPRHARSVQTMAFGLVRRVERWLLRHPRHRDHLQRVDLAPLVPAQLRLAARPSPSGLVHRFDDADVARVRALGLDLLLRCGSAILRGGILEAARLGVLSFHHADNRVNRGGPAAFWEVWRREPVTGFTIQRLTEELDGGQVLMRGHLATERTWLLNQAKLYRVSHHYLRRLVTDVAARGTLPPALPPQPYAHPLYRMPTAAQSLRWLARLVALKAGERLDRWRGRSPRWGVAWLRSDWPGAVLWRAERIANPPGHFLADPFVVRRDGRDVVFVEDWDDARGRGAIAAYELGDGGDGRGAQRLGLALDEPFHLSFPYLFEHGGALYMCPESRDAREIRVYRCVDFPLGWRLEKVLMREVSAVDTMLFEHGGRWWLATNIDHADSGDHCSELALYSAASPLADDWCAHPANPILVDARRARNGGLLRQGGRLYRVGQRQGFALYGEASVVHEIVRLDETGYEECEVCSVEPEFFPGLVGTHHLHSDGRTTVFDFCRIE